VLLGWDELQAPAVAHSGILARAAQQLTCTVLELAVPTRESSTAAFFRGNTTNIAIHHVYPSLRRPEGSQLRRLWNGIEPQGNSDT
jgi:hypothetical protein